MTKAPSQLKDDADKAFESGELKVAIQLYTEALKGSSTQGHQKLTLDEKRGILANRSEAYIKRKKFRNAVRDCNEGLSPIHLHKSQGSSTAQAMTARFHLRRAIGRNRLCRPTKAMEDYESFKKIWLSLGKTISSEDEGELIEIRQGLPLSRAFGLEDSGSEWEKGEDPDSDAENAQREHSTEVSSITQPVQQLGIEDDTDDEDFETQVVISAPYLNNPLSSSPTPFKIDMAVEDNGPLQFYLESLFQSAGNEHRGGADMVREYMFRAFEHQDPNKSKVFLVTRLNRVLEIPREATLNDILGGTRWPRDDPSPFKDWSKKPRRAKHGERDGPVVEDGGVVLFVIPNRYIKAWLKGFASK